LTSQTFSLIFTCYFEIIGKNGTIFWYFSLLKMKTENNQGLEHLSDSELVVRCLEKDNEAWDIIIRRYRRRIFNIAYQFVGRVDEAEDLSQEIFLKIFRSLHKFNMQACFAYWLIKVSKNYCIDYYRKKQKERAAIVQKMDYHTAVVPEEEDNPVLELEKKEKASVLQKAFSGLPKSSRICVIMRDIQGYTYQEIAEILKIPEGTVKSRINRGRKLLAQLLSEEHLLE
jgi:RNA polymerase sigma-70 factor (ECF subfamily)